MSNELVTLKTELEKAMPKLNEVAPKHLKVERVIRILLSACSRNPKLLECSKESVLNFCMRCSETGLEPIGAGGAWPVPYRNNKTNQTEMQFIPDYRGLVNCAKRAGCIIDAYAEVVKDADEFDYELGLTPKLTHKPATVDRGELINAYCIFEMPNGTKRFVVMDAEEIEGIRKRSRAADIGPWKTDISEMWKKTVVRRAMKPFAGMSPELDAAIDADNASTGITFEREPITMPKIKGKTIKGEIIPSTEPVAANNNENSTTSENLTSPPAPKFDRESVIKEIATWEADPKVKPKMVHKVMKEAGVEYDDGEDWKQANDEMLKSILSLIKCEK